jgi:hypothetical protein
VSGLLGQVVADLVGQVLDGCRHQLGLGGVVVQLRAAREPGALRNHRHRRCRVAELDQAVDRGVEQEGTRRRAALLLRATG